MTVIQLPLALVPSLSGWVWPSARLWPWVGVVAVTALSAHYCLTRAFRLADATIVVSMDFLRLPLIAMVGFVFYSEPLQIWVFVGALIVFAATRLPEERPELESRSCRRKWRRVVDRSAGGQTAAGRRTTFGPSTPLANDLR
jgi:hypothetical protein